jgi:hypothetical protein
MHGAPASEDEIDIDQIEVGEGESLEDIKAKLKPKKGGNFSRNVGYGEHL